jgi:PAS domain S-box-containing protein
MARGDAAGRRRSSMTLDVLGRLIHAAPVAMVALDGDGKVQMWNPAAERLFGFREEEVLGRRLPIVPEDEDVEFHARLTRCVRGSGVTNLDVRRRRKDGTTIDVSLSTSVVRDRHGRFAGALGVYVDITERRAAEEQVRRQLQRIAALRSVELAISSSLDMRVSLNVLLDQVTAELGVDAAGILLFDSDLRMLEYVADRGFRTAALRRTRLHVGESLAGVVALERRIVGIVRLSEAAGEFVRGPLLAEEGFVSYWAAPLIAGGQVRGVLELFHRAPLELGGERLEFLETLAGQGAVAIDHAALYGGVQRSAAELAAAYDKTIEGWSRALDLRDKETEGHSQRVTEVTERLGRAMGLPGSELIHARRGALLHDIGKMGIPDGILLKPGALDAQEWVIMKKHPVYAYELLSPISYLKSALDIPYCHHEKWDGSGYPRGLQGEQIPLAARLFAVADIHDALRSERPYRPAWPREKVLRHIESLSGSHLDPRVVKLFASVVVEERERK